MAHEIKIVGGIGIVPLNGGGFAVIDAGDVAAAAPFNWCLCPKGYVFRYKTRTKKLSLHRELLKAEGGAVVDHINGDPLDNRRCNLRTATVSQNQMNSRKRGGCTSAFKGVTWNKSSGKWQAQIKLEGKSTYLGLYGTEQEAHQAYVKAAREMHGEFANFGEVASATGKPIP